MMSKDSMIFKIVGSGSIEVDPNFRQGQCTCLYTIIKAPEEFAGFKTFEHIPVGLGGLHCLKAMLQALAGDEIRLVTTYESYALLHPTSKNATVPLRLMLTNKPE